MKKSKVSSGNSYLWMSIVFLVYLTILPTIIAILTPCMHATIGTSFSYQNCNTVLVLDRFVTLTLAGASLVLLISFFYDLKRTYRSLIVSALVLTLSTVSAYYLYAPRAERAIKKAPILLESLR